MDFSSRLQYLRRMHKLSQDKLGEIIGKSQRTVAAWECGDRAPTFETLCQIADYFDISVDYLIGRSDIQSPEDSINPPQDAPQRVDVQDDEAMPSDVKELKSLITQIVDQALDKRLPPSGRQ